MRSPYNKVQLVVTDTGPLIALARCGYLRLLSLLFNEIIVPETVKQELCLDQDLPGVLVLREELFDNDAFQVVSADSIDLELSRLLDPGEAEAISLAHEHNGILLIDERKGRHVALKRGIPIIGTGRVLVIAKQKGYLDCVDMALNKLRASGYRLSDSLCEELIRLAGE